MADEPAQSSTNRQLVLQKIYLKDLSFESPKAPDVFSSQSSPQTQLNMRSSTREVAPNTQEVTLTLTVEAKENDSTVFLVEVAQAGVFTMEGYTEQERAMLVGSYCPSTLYPYAREAVSDIVAKGGFPQLLLQPINFDALYAQAMQQRQQQQQQQQQPPTIQQPGIQQPNVQQPGAQQSAAQPDAPQSQQQDGDDVPARDKPDAAH